MRFLLVFIGIGFYIERAVSESGDCENLVNPPQRNFIHENSLEVDPCGPVLFKRCIPKDPPDNKCNTSITPNTLNPDVPYKLLISDYDLGQQNVKVSLVLKRDVEFFIEVHTADNDSYDPNSDKLGFFEDTVFPDCNSYACCDPTMKDRPNVARRCTNTTTEDSASPFYTVTYLWNPSPDFQGDVVFVAGISQDSEIHYAEIKSPSLFVGPFRKRKQETGGVQEPKQLRPSGMPIAATSAIGTDSGDCKDMINIPERNFIHGSSLEVDPCGPVIFKKCIPTNPPDDKCNTIIRPAKSVPYRLLISEYNLEEKNVQVTLIINREVEFFIEVHSADSEGNYDENSDKLGFFEDEVHAECNSYACCDLKMKDRPNVARKCTNTTTSSTSSTYTVSYLWNPMSDFQGDVVFVAAYSQSSEIHFTGIKSRSIFIGPFRKRKQEIDSAPPPKSSQSNSLPPLPPIPPIQESKYPPQEPQISVVVPAKKDDEKKEDAEIEQAIEERIKQSKKKNINNRLKETIGVGKVKKIVLVKNLFGSLFRDD